MSRKQLAALAALACIATPATAFDLTQSSPGVMFYVALPLDGRVARDQGLAFGMRLRGERDYQVVNVDTRMLSFLGTGIEAKWIIAGVVAAGATIAVTRDKSDDEPEQPPPPCQGTSSGCR
jgi:hypothetical protein